MSRLIPRSALVCGALASGLLPAVGHQEPGSSFTETAMRRPRPDLATLAERCAPRRQGPDSTAAFYDLLKLREQPDPQAVPVLERILADHQGSNQIHRFAAAQALFAIGSPQAQRVLARYLQSPSYPALQGIGYAFFHEMSPAQRDDFIGRYHLHNLAEDISLTLAVTAGADSSLLFTLTATNTSTRALRFIDPRHDLAALLFLRSEEGAYIPAQGLAHADSVRLEFARTKRGSDWVQVRPGARHEWHLTLRKRPVRGLARLFPGLAGDSAMVLDAADGYFDIRRPGRFQAIAILEQPQAAQAGPGCGEGAACWTGRAVSRPVPVEVRGP